VAKADLLIAALTAVCVFVSPGCTSSQEAVTPAGPRIVQPGAPGQASRVVSRQAATSTPLPHTDADVLFMQGMIGHHAQALDMTELIGDRTGRRDLHLLGRRITVSQKAEIDIISNWLRSHDEAVPEVTAHHMLHGDVAPMPGMLTAEQMRALEEASGDAFYRLWLENMIQHHQGALTMVGELFSQERAAQDTDIFRFAAGVDEDQTMEIARMRQMLMSVR